MVYAVNEEGVEALKGMASDITSAKDEIVSHAQKLRAASEGENLGPHAKSLADAADAIEAAINGAAEPIDEIASALNGVAEDYEEIIGDDVFAGIGGN